MTTIHAPVVDPDEFFSDAAIQDPYPLYDRMRETAPVHRMGDSDFFLVCGLDALNDAIRRVEDFSSNLTAVMTYCTDRGVGSFPMLGLGDPAQMLATADDPRHAVHRRMLVGQLAAKRIRATEPFVSQTFDQMWRRGVVGGEIEWMSALANRLPMMVVTRLIGVPAEDADMLIAKAYASTQLLDGLVSAEQLTASGIAAMELAGYIFAQFRQAIDGGVQDNLLGDMATAFSAGEIEDVAAAGIMVTLFSAAGESTASLLGSAVGLLVEKPEIQELLRKDPGRLAGFIEECLRYEAPFRGHYRHVLADTELGGVAVPANSRLLLLWGAANRDPAYFEAPAEFRLDRAEGKGHLSFGKGAHFCVGAALARLEATVVLRMLLDRTSWIDGVAGPWLPSVLVRRRRSLELDVRS
ncbi:MAG TPA: cytochrome P450 [Mycobacterium sp.]|nr:cytochrome P450 [Mycobacterium sp.]